MLQTRHWKKWNVVATIGIGLSTNPSTNAIESDEIEPTLQFIKKKISRTVTRPRFRGAPRTVRGPEQRGMHHKNYDRQPTYVNQIADVFNIYCVV